MDNEKRGLRERRRELGMTLGDLGRKSLIGIVDLSAFERGLRRRGPSDQEMERWAEALHWTVDELKAALPSAEEVEANRDTHQEHLIAAMTAAHKASKMAGFGKGRGGQGEIECPFCKGRLRFSVAGMNGHIWGAGDLETCVRWMQ